jgi:hypothetical protein
MNRLHRCSWPELAVLVAVLAVAGCGPKPKPSGGDIPGGEKTGPGLSVVPGGNPPTPGTPAKPGEFALAGRWETTEKLLLSAEDAQKLVPDSLRVSPDGRRWACGVKSDGMFKWVVDGKPSEQFTHINPANLVFSEDSQHHLLAGAVKFDDERVYLDGKVLDLPIRNLTVGTTKAESLSAVSDLALSPDGKQHPKPTVFLWDGDEFRYATVGEKEVEVNGKSISTTGASELILSKNGATSAFLTNREGSDCVVVNGVPHKLMRGIASKSPLGRAGQRNIHLSHDGAHVLHAGQSEGKWYVSFDNKWHEVGGELDKHGIDGYDEYQLLLSPDGTRWACRAGGAVYIDGKKESLTTLPVFSPDGKRFAFTSFKSVRKTVDGKEVSVSLPCVVHAGAEQPVFAWVDKRLTFSPNGQFLTYFASDTPEGQKGDSFLTVDGKKIGQPYSTVHGKVPPAFSPDSKSVGFVAKKTGDLFAVLDGQEQKTYDVIGPEGTRVGFTPDNTYTFIGVRGGAYYWVEAKRK